MKGFPASSLRRILQATPGLAVGLLLAACRGGRALLAPLPATAPGPGGAGDASAPATQPAAGGATLTPLIPTPEPQGYWVQPGVPYSLLDRIAPALREAGLVEAPTPEAAIIRITLNPGPDAALTTRWAYALAAPFATTPDDVAWAGLASYWQGGAPDGLPDFGGSPQVVITPDGAALLEALLGPPAGTLPLQIIEPAALADWAWEARPSISLVPFDALTPRWKVLLLDGQSVLDPALNMDTYPLAVSVGVEAVGDRGQQVAAGLVSRGLWPAANRDPARLTTVVVTGVTALVRATAKTMEIRGVGYPAEAIQPFFDGTDILHTSNEVAFSADCPAPEWTGDPEGFCSHPANFELLKSIGLDVVELTGNHINDFGTAALDYTLDLYDANGMLYYGGGRNLDDARAPRIMSAPDGTRIAFVGCNDPGPFGAFATAESPGAAPCDDWVWLHETIRSLKANHQADLVIATVQYWELPGYAPTEAQAADFAALAEAGADIVSGSHAHQPQGFAFVGGSFIHYGVGNLFFDQMDYIENRQMFADKHVLYEGRHISTVLFTGLMEDWAQPNPMTPEDRAAFLQLIFEASGW